MHTPERQWKNWILSTDFDGTIHNPAKDPKISHDFMEWVADFRAHGGVWVVNTGRELSYLMAGLRQSGSRLMPDYVIVVEREIYQFHHGDFEPVFPWFRQCEIHHREVFERYQDNWPDLIQWIEAHAKAVIYQDKYSPFSVIADDLSQAEIIHEKMEKEARSLDTIIYVHNSIYGRFAHADYHKGSALKELARILSVPASQVIVAGDHWNDMSMFDSSISQNWIAPQNAIPPIHDHVRQFENGFVSSKDSSDGVLDGLHFLFAEKSPKK